MSVEIDTPSLFRTGKGVFYKLAWGDFEAIMQQKSLMNEGAMRASWLNAKETDANESPKSTKQKRHPDRNMKTNL